MLFYDQQQRDKGNQSPLTRLHTLRLVGNGFVGMSEAMSEARRQAFVNEGVTGE